MPTNAHIVKRLEDSIAATEREIARLEGRSAAPGIPGTYLTGNSGVPARRRRQLDRQLDRTIDNAVKLTQVLYPRLKGLKHQLYREENIDEIRAKEAAEKIADEAGRKAAHEKAKATRNAAPIVNDPGFADLHITSAEWKAKPKDYKGIALDEKQAYRYRRMIHNFALCPVYITDMKDKLVEDLV